MTALAETQALPQQEEDVHEQGVPGGEIDARTRQDPAADRLDVLQLADGAA